MKMRSPVSRYPSRPVIQDLPKTLAVAAAGPGGGSQVLRWLLPGAVLVLAAAAWHPAAQAQLYKCRTETGQTIYQQAPCDGEVPVARPAPRAAPPRYSGSGQDQEAYRDAPQADAELDSEAVAELRRQEWAARREALEAREADTRAFNRVRHEAAVAERQRLAEREQLERAERDQAIEQAKMRDRHYAAKKRKEAALREGRREPTHANWNPPPAPPRPPETIRCNDFGCRGSDGTVYRQTPTGELRGGGKTCRPTTNGKWADCF